jgi:circadian clock protein KaiC
MQTPASLFRQTMPCLRSGVPGLDELLGGGLPESSFSLLAGPTGSGKTTLAHQIMFALASPTAPAMYFTVLGEPPLKMLRHQRQFEFFDLVKLNQAIRFINLSDDLSKGGLDQVLTRVKAELESRRPHLVFFDAFQPCAQSCQVCGALDIGIHHLIQSLSVLMASWQVTSLLICDSFNEAATCSAFNVADGLICLTQHAQGACAVRLLEVRKMRGLATTAGAHAFHINAQGIHIGQA